MVARAFVVASVFGFVLGSAAIVFPGTAAAGINQEINFQGKVVNTNGTNVADGSYTFVFKLYTAATGGTAVWTDTETLSVSAGIFQYNLGSNGSDPLPGSVNFDSGNVYLGMSFNGDPEMTPRILMTAAPYAFQSLNSDELGGLTASQFAQLSPASAQAGYLNVTGNITSGATIAATTSLQAPLLDTATAGQLKIGTGTATSILMGQTSTPFTIQGNSSSTFTATSGGITTTLGFQTPSGSNDTLTLPNVGGTICTTVASTCSGTYATGSTSGSYLAKNGTDTSAAVITAGNYLYGFTNSQTTATTGGVLDLSNGANTGNALYVTASGNPAASTNALVVVNNTAGSPSGNLVDLQQNGSNVFSVDYAGNVTQTGGTSTTDTINGQRISSAANFTGTVTAATSVLTPLVDTASAGVLAVGTNNATAIDLNQNTVVASGKNFTVSGGNSSLTGPSAGSSYAATVASGAASNQALVLQGSAGQTGNLLSNEDANGVTLSKFDANGNYYGVGTQTSLGALQEPAFTNASTAPPNNDYYVMTATNAQGETLPSASIVMANNTGTLTWNQVPGATGYKIYRNTTNSFTSGSLLLTTITNGSTTSYTDTGSSTTTGLPPTSASQLYLKVTSDTGAVAFTINGYGNAAANVGLQVGGQTSLPDGTHGTLLVSQVNGVRGEVIDAVGSGNAFEIQDNNTATLAGYSSAADYTSNGTNQNFLALQAPTNTTTTNGTTDYYVITATNAQGETVASASVGMSSSSATITWNQVPGATGYKIYRNTLNSFATGSLLRATITNGTTTSYTDNGAGTGAGVPPTAPTGTGVVVQGWSGQSANLLQAENSGGSSVFSVGPTGTTTLGTANANTGTLIFSDGTSANTATLTINGASGGSFDLPNNSTLGQTICTTVTTSCGSTAGSGYVINQPNITGTAQTGNFNLSASGVAGVSLQAPLFDSPSGTTTLNIGTNNATAGIDLNQNTLISGTKTLSVNGGLSALSGGLTETGTAQINASGAGATTIGNSSGGAISIQGGASGATINTTAGGLTLSTTTSGTLAVTSAGALNLTGAAPSTWSIGAGNALGITSSNLNVSTGGVLSVSTGYQIGGASAATGTYLRGNGTDFVASAIQYGDVPTCGGTCNYIGNQTSQQASSNFNISGTGIAATSFQAPLIDSPVGTGTLAIGAASGGNATAIDLNQNTVIASNKSLTAKGSVTFQDATNSTSALVVENNGGTPQQVLTVDTTDGEVGVDGGSPNATLEVQNNSGNSLVFNAVDNTNVPIIQGYNNGEVSLSKAPSAPVGNPVAGIVGGSDDGDIVAVNLTTSSLQSGALASISVYINGPIASSPHNLGQVGIYSDSSGAPGSLLAASSQNALTANAWNTFSISYSLSASTTYWLVYWENSAAGENKIGLENPTVGTTLDLATSAFNTGGSFPGTWPGSFFSNNTYDASIYASFAASNGGALTIYPSTNQVQLGYNTGLYMQGAGAYISNPQGQTDSEAFGLNASVTGSEATALGEGSFAGYQGTAVGQSSYATGASVAVGTGANGNFTNSVALGNSAQANNNSIAIGAGVTARGSNQLVIGSSTAGGADIQNVYIGSGVYDSTPTSVTINATQGNGTNVGGASITLAGGQGTGNAVGGNVNFQVAKAGSSGSSLNSLATVASLNGANGSATFENSANSTTAFQIQNAGGQNVVDGDTSNGQLILGTSNVSSGVNGKLVFQDGTTDGDTATLDLQGALTGTTTYNLPNVSGTQTICTTLSTTACDSVYEAAGSYLLQNPAATDSSTSTLSSGDQYSFTQSGTGAEGNIALLNSGTAAALSVTGSGNPSGTDAIEVINNSAGTPSGNSLDIQKGGVNELSVDYNGNISQINGTSTTDTINGQTISAAASFTGTVTAATSVLAPLVDTASAGVLAIGTTHATAIDLNQNTVIATGKSLTADGTATFEDSSNSATAFQVQNNGGKDVVTGDTSGNQLILGTSNTASGVNGKLNFADGTADGYGGTIDLQGTLPGNATYNLPNVAGTQTICTTLSTTACDTVYQAAGNYLLQNPASTDSSTSTLTSGDQYSFTQSGTGAEGNLQLSNAGTAAALSLSGSGNPSGISALEVINNTAGTPSGNSLDIQKGGANELSVDYNGNINQINGSTTTDTINGQTISAAASFTGTITAATSVLTPLVDTATAAALAIGTTNATAIDLNQNTVIATNKSLTAEGSATFVDATNSNSAFQIENSSGNQLLGVDSLGTSVVVPNASLVTPNGGFGQYGNMLQQSEAFSGAPWSNTGVNVTNNSAVAPNGKSTASTATSTSSTNYERQSVTVTASTTYTFSWWAKGGTMAPDNYAIYDSTHAAYIVNPTAYAVGTGWQRFSVTFTTPSGTTSIYVYPINNSGTTSLGTEYLWGAQLEQSSSAGTYVATTTNAATGETNGLSVDGNTLLENQANSTTALQLQNASGQDVVTGDTTNGQLLLGTSNVASGVNGKLVFQDGTTDGDTATLDLQGALTGTTTYNLPNVSGTQTICTTLSTTACDTVYQAAGAYLLQNPAATDTSTSTLASGDQYSFTQSATGAEGNIALVNAGTAAALTVSGSGNPSGTNAIEVINNTGGTPSGNSLDIQKGGVNELSVDYNGNISQINGTSTTDTINGQTISGAASFTGTVTAATSLLAPLVDTASAGGLSIGTSTATSVTIGKTTTTATVNGALQVGASAGSGSLLNNGSTTNTVDALTNFTSSGPIAQAAIDDYTYLSLAQTTTGITLSVPSPTASTVYGKVIYISNIGTASVSLTLGSITDSLAAGSTATIVWANKNGGAGWSFAGADAGSLQSAYNTSAGAAPSIAENTTNNALTVQASATSGISAGNELFGVRSAAANDTTLGASDLTVDSGGVGIGLGSAAQNPTVSYNLQLGNGTNTGQTIQVTSAAAVATTGGALTVQAATGNTSGLGGQLNLNGGTGGNAAAGGQVIITGGTSGGGATAGGAVTLQGGASNATAGSNGGGATVQGGNGTSTGTGGAGGNVNVTGGSSFGSNANTGGTVQVEGGTGSPTGNGGGVTVQGGSGGSTSGNGGLLTLQGGSAVAGATSVGGGVTIAGGVPAAVAGSQGGAISITAGAGTTTGTGAAGNTVTVSGGAGGGTAATAAGGAISINGGAASTTSTTAIGGDITLQAGSTTDGGNAGNIHLTAGNATGGGTPGVVYIDTPVFTSSGTTDSFGTTNTMAVSLIDNNSTVVVNATAAGLTLTIPTPSNTAIGRTVYITVANGSNNFTMSLTGGPTLNMLPNTTAALVYNGTGWTGGSAASSLQQVYNDTSTSPASIVTTSSTKTLLVQAGSGDDASNLFTIENSFGSPAFNINSTQTITTNSTGTAATSTNLIQNPGIEANPLTASGTAGGYSATGAATVTRSTNYAYAGNASLSIAATTASGDGAKQAITSSTGTATALTASTAYYLSWYANGAGTAVTSVLAEYAYNGTTFTNACTPGSTTISAAYGWTRYSCTFTTGSGGTAPTTSNAIEIIQNATQGATHTFYLDALQLETTGVSPYEETSMQTASVITSPVDLWNTNNSTTALSVQNAAGTSLFNLDTLNDALNVSNASYALAGNAASSLTTTSGALTITSAAATTWSATTGQLTIDTAASTTAATAGGELAVTTGAGDTSGAGGELALTSGNGGSSGAGGEVAITSGNGGGGNTGGGEILVQGGAGSGTGQGGVLLLQAGIGGATAGGNGGTVTLQGGNGGTGNGAGGSLAFDAGNATTGATAAENGGNITLLSGTEADGGTAGNIVAKTGTNSATGFQVQNSSGVADMNVDTTDNNGCVEVGTQATATSGSYTTCVGQSHGNGTLVVNSGTQYYSGLAFAQLNSSDVNTTNTTNYSQLLGIDSAGNVGISNAAVSLTSPALAYWDGQNDPTLTPASPNNSEGYAYPTPTATGSATFVSSALGERLTTTTANQSGSLNWSFAQVPFEEVQFQFQSGGGNGADATWFYSYANSVPTSEYGNGMTACTQNTSTNGCGYIIYFDEYWDCIGVTYGSFTDGHQCNTAGGTGNPLAAYSFSNLNGTGNGGPNHYAADAVDDGNWHNVDIQFFYNQIIVRWDGQIVIDYSDTYGRDLSYQDFGFGARNGSNYNNHYIKGLLVTKLGTNTSQYDINNVNAPLASNLYWDNSFNSGNTTMNQGAIGVGTADPTATLETDGTAQFDTIAEQSSATATVCESNAFNCTSTTSGNDVFGTGTSFTSAMVGDKITFYNGASDTIATVVNSTELTTTNTHLEDSNNTQPGVGFTIYEPGLSITGSASANTVLVGSTTAGQQITYLGLNNYEASGPTSADPSGGVDGDMYYNADTNQFRCYTGGGWQPCNGIWQTLMVGTDESRASSATLTADGTMTFAMAASTSYSIRCQVYFGSTSATPQFKWEETGPAGATSIDASHEAIPEGASSTGLASATGLGGLAEWVDVGINTAASTSNNVELSQLTSGGTAQTNASGEGSLTLNTQWQNGATAGTWAFAWAQLTSNATATKVRAGSYCDYVAGD